MPAATKMAARWIPNHLQFFEAMGVAIQNARLYLTSNQGDLADYWSRRLEEYERTVRVLLGRMEETYPERVSFLRDLMLLLVILGSLRETMDMRAYREESYDEVHPIHVTLLEGNGNRERGRPRYLVPESQIRALRQGGFRWADIARQVGISPLTLRRRRVAYDMSIGENFDNVSDAELDNIVREILHRTPQAGRGLIQGALRSRQLSVQRERIRASIRRVDPVTLTLRNARHIIRRRYNVPCPNALW